MRHWVIAAFVLLITVAAPYQAFCQSKAAPSASKGQKLFKALNCSMCHSVSDAGGCMGPALAQVTKRRTDQYLRLRLGAGKEDQFIALIKHPELFPHPRFRTAEVTSLIAYLKTLNDKPLVKVGHKSSPELADSGKSGRTFVPAEPSASSREGRRLFLQTGCMACHSLNNTGGAVGPALDGIGALRSRQYIEAHVSNPQAHLKSGKSKMVQSELMPDQVKNITDFLMTLPKI